MRCATTFLCLLAIAGPVCSQLVLAPTAVYQYTAGGSTVQFRSNPIRSKDTAAFFLVYDDVPLNRTYVQFTDPSSPLWRPHPPVSLAGINLFPGPSRVYVAPVFNGRAAVLAWSNSPQPQTPIPQGSNNGMQYAYYNVSVGTVYLFPGQPFAAFTFGKEQPWWDNGVERSSDGTFSDNSRFLYSLSGCTSGQGSAWIVSQFDPWQLIQKSHRTWTQFVPTSNCTGALPSFIAYEDDVWLATPEGRVVHLDATSGDVLLNQTNPCNFADVSNSNLVLSVTNLGYAKGGGAYGLPLNAFILSSFSVAKNSLQLCHFSHRSYAVRWTSNLPRINQLWSDYRIASAGSTVFMVWWLGNDGTQVGEIAFIDRVQGDPVFLLQRSAGDYSNYPTPIIVPLDGGGCQNSLLVQISGVLTLLCVDTVDDAGYPVLWVSTVAGCPQWPATNPSTTVVVCKAQPQQGITLVSLVDGSVVWQASPPSPPTAPAATATSADYMSPLVSRDLVWYYQGNGSVLVASPFTAAASSSSTAPSSSSSASSSSGGGGVSSGTAAAVFILMLVVGAVIGVALFTQVYQKRIKAKGRQTYSEVMN